MVLPEVLRLPLEEGSAKAGPGPADLSLSAASASECMHGRFLQMLSAVKTILTGGWECNSVHLHVHLVGLQHVKHKGNQASASVQPEHASKRTRIRRLDGIRYDDRTV